MFYMYINVGPKYCTPEIKTPETIEDFQWCFPMEFHCCDFWCETFCPDNGTPHNEESQVKKCSDSPCPGKVPPLEQGPAWVEPTKFPPCSLCRLAYDRLLIYSASLASQGPNPLQLKSLSKHVLRVSRVCNCANVARVYMSLSLSLYLFVMFYQLYVSYISLYSSMYRIMSHA